MRLLLVLLLACAPKAAAPPTIVEAPPVPAPPDLLGPRPEVGPEVPFLLPVPEVGHLSNGASVWTIPARALPLVTVTLQVAGGSTLDPVGREGTVSLTDRMLTQGAGKRDATTFAQDVERLGVQLDVSTDWTGSTITMSMMKDKLEPALDLMADMVLRPRFTRVDFAREQDLAISDLIADQDEPVAVASRLAFATWFGPAHPYGRPVDGTVAAMKSVTLKDLKAAHGLAWNASGAHFTVAGDVSPTDVLTALEPRLGQPWKATKARKPVIPAAPVHDKAPIVLVDKPGSAQTMFYLVFAGAPFGDPGVAPLKAGTIVLGGTFTSRLNQLLREKRGYTYGAKARVVGLPGTGVLAVTTRIRTDATGPAMTDLVAELARIRQGVTKEELVKARGAYQSDLVEAMESRDGIAAVFAPWHELGFPPAAPAAELAGMRMVTPDAVPEAMAAYDPARAVVILVGDRAVIEGPLKDAGFGEIQVVEPL